MEDSSPSFPAHVGTRILSGSVASIVTSLVVTPLEVVKVRLQANIGESSNTSKVIPCPRGCGTFVLYNGQMDCVLPKSAVQFFDASGHLTKQAKDLLSNTPRSYGTFAMIRRIFSREGLSGLYAGLAPTLVMAVPNTVLYYSAYDEIVWNLRKIRTSSSSSSSSTHQSSVSSSPSFDWSPLLAGASARVLATSVTAPFEMLRTRQAAAVGQNETPTHGIWRALRDIMQKEGVMSLYRGLGPTLWRDVPFSSIYWLSLEHLRQAVALESDAPYPASEQFIITFLSGALSGAIAAAVTTPFDVVKTRQQAVQHSLELVTDTACTHNGATAYHHHVTHPMVGTLAHLRHIAHTEGMKALWSGNQARMLKVAPGCAIMITTYELGKYLLE